MALRIEDYALIGDCQTGALVGCDGSIDWLSLPRFDSGACFAALLGTPEHGRWIVTPACEVRSVRRRYREDTMVLETEFDTKDGTVTLVDCMPPRSRRLDLVRVVVGRRGTVPMRMELIIRFDYGAIVPWVRGLNDGIDGIQAVAGPDALCVRTPVPLRGENLTTVADFAVTEGERIPWVLTWYPSHRPAPPPIDAEEAVRRTETWWREWVRHCTYDGDWRDAVVRSLLTLKAMIYAPTGGIVAAVTTSLPEQLGDAHNWDYRYCWLRDATFTLYALLNAGYEDEARAWREWLLRAVAGTPDQLQIMYGLAGERRLTEFVVNWLPGYEGSSPVRIGNAAHQQFQLDVFGELMDTAHVAYRAGLEPDANTWHLQRALLDHLESAWKEPDNGIWETRRSRRHFTHSKVMAWVAVDRAVKAVERFGCDGPVDRWRRLRATIHEEVCRRGFDATVGSFVQSYGAKELDASLLMIPLVGFLPASDPRVRGTVDAIERQLMIDGFVTRSLLSPAGDGLPNREAAFLLCTFWLADNFALLGRHHDARHVFERLLDVRNDVGLLAEQYDPGTQRQLGNFPQAFSHVALVNTACNLSRTAGPATHRAQG